MLSNQSLWLSAIAHKEMHQKITATDERITGGTESRAVTAPGCKDALFTRHASKETPYSVIELRTE